MGEPEARPETLPQGMQLKSGRYYLVKRDPVSKKVVWTSLSRDLSRALREYRLLTNQLTVAQFEGDEAPSFWLSDMAKALHDQTLKRAREADILYALSPEIIVRLGHQTNWRCAVTGLRFRREKPDGAQMRPYMPSIDRTDCTKGYTFDNCRMVCVITNFALNNWGEGPLRELVISYAERHGLSIPVRKRVRKIAA